MQNDETQEEVSIMKKGLAEVDLAFVALRVCNDLLHAEGLKELEAFEACKTAEWLGKLWRQASLAKSVALPRRISSCRICRKPWTT